MNGKASKRSFTHFEGKKPFEHLKEARKKGLKAQQEVHGSEAPGSLAAFADSAREASLSLLFIWTALLPFHLPKNTVFMVLGFFAIGYTVWKGCRAAILGWTRLQRLHRLIEQERYEITHHREQEKEELKEMYQAKGFSGQLLEEAVEILMADDNRLLEVMLTEELGLTLEAFEHPLKQAASAFIGAIIAFFCTIVAAFFGGFLVTIAMTAILFGLTAYLSAKIEGNPLLQYIIWYLAIGFFAEGALYFLVKWVLATTGYVTS